MSVLKVRELMTKRVETLTPDEDLDFADMLMRLEKFRHLPVVNAEGKLIGLVSQRDLLAAQGSTLDIKSEGARRKRNLYITAQDVMTEDLKTIHPEAPALQAAETLKEHRIGCLPVVEDQEVIGIITEADFLGYVIKSLSDTAL